MARLIIKVHLPAATGSEHTIESLTGTKHRARCGRYAPADCIVEPWVFTWWYRLGATLDPWCRKCTAGLDMRKLTADQAAREAEGQEQGGE